MKIMKIIYSYTRIELYECSVNFNDFSFNNKFQQMTDKTDNNVHKSQAPAPPAELIDSIKENRNDGSVSISNHVNNLDFSILRRNIDKQDLDLQVDPSRCQQNRLSKADQIDQKAPQFDCKTSSQQNEVARNSFLLNNFQKLTQRSPDAHVPLLPTQNQANAPVNIKQDLAQYSFEKNEHGVISTLQSLKENRTRLSCGPSLKKDCDFKNIYQKHLEDRVRNSSSASRMSLNLVKQAQDINNEANLDRFNTAQEISQEIISGRSSSRRHTIDPRMLMATDHQSTDNPRSTLGNFNINFVAGQNSKKIEFNPNSLGLNQLRDVLQQQNLTEKQPKNLENISQFVEKNDMTFGQKPERDTLMNCQSSDMEHLIRKTLQDGNIGESNGIEDSLCLEGGFRSTMGGGAQYSEDGQETNTNIDYMFPQTISHYNVQSRTTAKSLETNDKYQAADSPRIRQVSCCTHVYDLFACLLWPIGWLFYHLFCCFMCNKKRQMFTVPPHMLQRHLKKRKQSEDTKTMSALIHLLKNTPKSISYLSSIRINPQLNKMDKKKVVGKKHSIKLRSDLEFFIPQLVSHFLRADLSQKEVDQMKEFFLKASQASIFFAHRVWFNLKASLINKDNQVQVKKILTLISELEAKLFSCTEEKLYIANSSQLIKLISKTNLENLLDEECLRAIHQEELIKKQNIKSQNYLVNLFSNKHSSDLDGFKKHRDQLNKFDRFDSHDNQNETEVSRLLKGNSMDHQNYDEEQPEVFRFAKKQMSNIKSILSIFNFQIMPYKKQINCVQFQPTDASFITPSQQSNNQQYFLRAFLSTPQFISDLTDISVKILKSENKEKFLHDNLQKMNKSLPSATYVPILSSTFARNYMVLNIAYPESRLFITAEKAPFLICIEVFQPQELELHLQNLHAQERPRAYEILQQLNLVNKDQTKLIQKINQEMSKPVYILNANANPNKKKIASDKRKMSARRQHEAIEFSNVNLHTQNQDDMLNDKFSFSSGLNYNSHEGIITNNLHSQSEIHNGRNMQETIKERKSLNYQYFLNDINDQVSSNLQSQEHEEQDQIKVDHQQTPNSENKTSSDFKTARDGSIERSSVNDHYGFYQTPAKVIKQDINEHQMTDQPNNEHDDASFVTAHIGLQPSNQNEDEHLNDIMQYEKMQRSTVMSFYDEDQKQNQSYRHTVQIDQVETIGQRLPEDRSNLRNTIHVGNERLQNIRNDGASNQDSSNNFNNPELEQESQSQGGQGEQKVATRETLVSASALDEVAHQESEYTQAIPEFQSLEEKDIDNYFRELNEKIFTSEPLAKQEQRVRNESAYGHFKTWKMLKIIVKSGDDLRSEQFAMQLIETIDLIFKKRKLKLKLQPYDIVSTGINCGIVEFISDAMSIDYIKKKMLEKTGRDMDLVDFYRIRFGNIKSSSYKNAINNLVDSLAAYSLVCYILQIKDRHNANILINQNDGSLVHIDFGFILASRLLNFETAPFKITGDIIRLLGGLEGKGFKRFRERMVEGYMALHEDNEKLLVLVKMLAESQADLPCFKRGAEQAIAELCQRLTPLGPNVRLDKAQCTYEVDKIIGDAYRTWSTYVYDQYQYCCQGIL